jgi:hypothetical protein
MLQNNLYDKAQALNLPISFTRIGEERGLSYNEALSALPQLLPVATSIKFWTCFGQSDTGIDWLSSNTFITTLSHIFGSLINTFSSDQAQ